MRGTTRSEYYAFSPVANVIILERWHEADRVSIMMNFSAVKTTIPSGTVSGTQNLHPIHTHGGTKTWSDTIDLEPYGINIFGNEVHDPFTAGTVFDDAQ